MLQDLLEVRVARGPRNAQVECQIMADGLVSPGEMVFERLQGFAHVLQLLRIAALRGQAGRFGLQADAQLQHGQHIHRFAELMGVEQRARTLPRRQHKSAYAMPGVDQPGGLQLGERFAHHRAADVVTAHQLGLGGQLVPFLQQALADLVPKLFRQEVRQAAAAATDPAAQRRAIGGR
ncbi:hypothetical protein D3C78_1183240 [compost metagenome]